MFALVYVNAPQLSDCDLNNPELISFVTTKKTLRFEGRRYRDLQVEVAVMVFREDLEGGSLPRSAIDAKVAEYRAKLIAESDSAAAEADRKGALARCTAGCLRDELAQAALVAVLAT